MQKKTIYEPVKASEELPENKQVVILEVTDKNGIALHGDGYIDKFNEKDQWFLGDHKHDFPVKFTQNVTHWLKQSEKYVFGEDELRAFLIEGIHSVTGGYPYEKDLDNFLTSKGIPETKPEIKD